jgi:hypothetical protein
MDELRMLTIRAFEIFCGIKKLANVSKKLAKISQIYTNLPKFFTSLNSHFVMHMRTVGNAF